VRLQKDLGLYLLRAYQYHAMFSEKFNGPRNFVPVRYSIHKVGPAGAKTIVCLGRWARFAHRRANVASEHKGLRAAMVVANVGALRRGCDYEVTGVKPTTLDRILLLR
jgi:hypothetical protein